MTCRWLLKYGREGLEEKRRSAVRGVREEARRLIDGCDDPVVLREDVAPRVGKLLGRDAALFAEGVALVGRRYRTLSGVSLPVAVWRAACRGGGVMARDLSAGALRSRERTEMGNALRLLDRYGEGLMYVDELGAWYHWTGARWERISLARMRGLAQTVVRDMIKELAGERVEAEADRREGLEWCLASQTARMYEHMVTCAESVEGVLTPAGLLDADAGRLGVENGSVNLRTGRLEPPEKGLRITRSCGVVWDDQAECPLFEETVRGVFQGDAEMVGFFQRLVGYTVLGTPALDPIFVIAYGMGANGKSTVLGAVRHALGDYARAADASSFIQDSRGGNRGGPREDILRLAGTRMCYITESPDDGHLHESLVKSMTGGEPLPARGVHGKHTIEVMPTWVAWLPTNHRPVVRGSDYGIWRRVLLLPFTRNFDTDPTVAKDPGRLRKLEAEAPGILKWIVRGALAYQSGGLRVPTSVRAATQAYQEEEDVLSEWLASCCTTAPNVRDTTNRLWASWEAWAKSHGMTSRFKSRVSFVRRLSQNFASYKESRTERGFVGVAVQRIIDF